MLRFGRLLKAITSRKTNVRYMGGSHGHGHSHGGITKPAEPYSIPHHDAYPSEAYFLGIEPGAKAEGWELPFYIFMGISAGILIIGQNTKDNNTFTAWARREALAREKVVEAGGTVEFGKYYSENIQYEQQEVDKPPTVKAAE